MLTILLIVLIVLALGGGGYAYRSAGPYYGGGIGIGGILLILIVAWLFFGMGGVHA
jgi:hypothetical protein